MDTGATDLFRPGRRRSPAFYVRPRRLCRKIRPARWRSIAAANPRGASEKFHLRRVCLTLPLVLSIMTLMKSGKYIGDRAFYSRLFRVMTPVLVQNVITNFVNLLDNIMVGRLGTEPMSGVAIVNQLLFVFNLCVFGGLAGAGILAAQFCGSGDHEGVRHTFRAKCLIAAGTAAVFAAVFALYGEELI